MTEQECVLGARLAECIRANCHFYSVLMSRCCFKKIRAAKIRDAEAQLAVQERMVGRPGGDQAGHQVAAEERIPVTPNVLSFVRGGG
jgi:hypothetical protein